MPSQIGISKRLFIMSQMPGHAPAPFRTHSYLRLQHFSKLDRKSATIESAPSSGTDFPAESRGVKHTSRPWREAFFSVRADLAFEGVNSKIGPVHAQFKFYSMKNYRPEPGRGGFRIIFLVVFDGINDFS